MRTLFLVLLLFSLSEVSVAQQAELYALGNYNAHKGQSIGLFNTNDFFVRINPISGKMNIVADLDQTSKVMAGTSIFDYNNNAYLYLANNSFSEDPTLYTLDATNGEVLNNTNYFSNSVDYQYDMKNNLMYGLRYSSDFEHLESFYFNADTTKTVSELGEIKSFSLGVATFDSNNSRYIFVGSDKNYEERLYCMDTKTGEIISKPKLGHCYIHELEYDVQANRLYALFRKKNETDDFFFAEIALNTGEPISTTRVPNLLNINIGTSVVDQENRLYIFSGIDVDFKHRLYTLDIESGSVIFNTELENNITALKFDNTIFANRFYDTGRRTEQNSLVLNSLTATRILNYTTEFTTREPYTISIYDMLGVRLFHKNYRETEGLIDEVINVSTFHSGIYSLRLASPTKLYIEPFVKEDQVEQ